MTESGQLQCTCGRIFTQQNSFSVHKGSCNQSKKRTLSVVDKARELLANKKRRKVAAVAEKSNGSKERIGPVVVCVLCFFDRLRVRLMIAQENPENIVRNAPDIQDVQVCFFFFFCCSTSKC